MPELPEVENLRLGLTRHIIGQKILGVKIFKPKLVSGNGTKRIASSKKVKEFIKGIVGERFIDIDRRAKNLIFKLSNGKRLISHLKMSGQFVYKNANKKETIIGGHPIKLSETKLPNKHSHIIFKLTHGALYYNDIRMFGYMLYYKDIKDFEKENHFQFYGIEPLSKEFTLEYFKDSLKNKRGKIKIILMNQKIVTGLGNIYADESLFEAGIKPLRSPNSLNKKEVEKQRTLIQIILDYLRRLF